MSGGRVREAGSLTWAREVAEFAAALSHVEFAHAFTNLDLVRFARRFGPVNGKKLAPGPLAQPGSPIEVEESLQRLHRERKVMAAVLRLLGALRDRADAAAANSIGDFLAAAGNRRPQALCVPRRCGSWNFWREREPTE